MKSIFLLLFSFTYIISNAQYIQEKTIKANLNLNGNVKSVEYLKFDLQNNTLVPYQFRFFTREQGIYEFSSLGKIVKHKHNTGSIEFDYELFGETEKITYKDSNNSILNTEEYGYINGKIKRISYFDSIHKNNGTSEYTYKKYKTEIIEHWITPKNERYKTVLKYDKLKNLIQSEEYENGKLSDKKYYSYDDSSRITSNVTYNFKKQKVETHTYTYKTSGDLKSEKLINHIDSTEKTISYTFDSITKTILINTITEKLIELEKFDDQGLLLIRVTTILDNKDLMKFEYIYEFDSHKNWIKKTEVVNGIPNTLTERKIIYFD